jgi:transposase-like protein
MPEPTVQEKTTVNLREQWRERIAEHARSGVSIKQFCKARGIAEHAFYYWRKRLRQDEPVRFALIDRSGAAHTTEWNLELLLVSGERLRIGASVDPATLRIVLTALRA